MTVDLDAVAALVRDVAAQVHLPRGTAVRPDLSPYRPDDDRAGLLAAADHRTAKAALRGLGLHRGG